VGCYVFPFTSSIFIRSAGVVKHIKLADSYLILTDKTVAEQV